MYILDLFYKSATRNAIYVEYIGPGREREHLREKTTEDNKKQLEQIMELKEQGMSLREIGQRMGLSHTKIAKILREAETRGEV